MYLWSGPIPSPEGGAAVHPMANRSGFLKKLWDDQEGPSLKGHHWAASPEREQPLAVPCTTGLTGSGLPTLLKYKAGLSALTTAAISSLPQHVFGCPFSLGEQPVLAVPPVGGTTPPACLPALEGAYTAPRRAVLNLLSREGCTTP